MRFSPIFTDHAVLPAHKTIRVYGDGDGQLAVSLAGITTKTISKSGRWSVDFPPMDYGGPYELKLETANATIVLSDIYVGEVYLFSGQSNMQFKLSQSNTPKSEYEDLDMLRYFSAQRPEKGDYFTPENGWVISRADEVAHWSSIAYITSRAISKQKRIAVGAIFCAQGASVIESWVPCGAFDQRGISIPLEMKYPDHICERYSSWNKDGMLYESMLSQIFPYSLTGVVWYQGESDTSLEEGAIYADELRALIEIWRQTFCDNDLPFIIVQIADLINAAPGRNGWKMIQSAQEEVGATMHGVTTVISHDICENDMIHPISKFALSNRIAEALMRFNTDIHIQ